MSVWNTNASRVAFDDQTSTFIIPAGAGFEVVFCPGARSTNILATETQRLHELAESGHVSKNKGTQSTIMKRDRTDVFRRSGSARNFRLDPTAVVVAVLMTVSLRQATIF